MGTTPGCDSVPRPFPSIHDHGAYILTVRQFSAFSASSAVNAFLSNGARNVYRREDYGNRTSTFPSGISPFRVTGAARSQPRLNVRQWPTISNDSYR